VIRLFSPEVPQRAIDRAVGVLRSGWLNQGPVTAEFETEFRRHIGCTYAVALNSCTSALQLALNAIGVGPGSEVIVPSQTFIATAQAVLAERARVVFTDVDPATGSMDTEDLERRITERTRAIIPVHFLGYPCDMAKIKAIATDAGIDVIEDCAQALGATYQGQAVGGFGRFACFSFQATKVLTTADGGMLTGTRACDEATLRRRCWFGLERGTERDVTEVGFKYQMNDVCAALGVEQLPMLGAVLERRHEIDLAYRQRLAEVDGLRLLEFAADRESACGMFTVRVARRSEFVAALRSRGVEVAVLHPRIDRHPVFGDTADDRPGQDHFEKEQVSLPLHPSLSDEDVETVVAAVLEGW